MNQKSCYGTMFPATLGRSADDGTATGKVFRYDIAPLGLAGLKRTTNADMKEWNDCLQCDDFDSCYKLSSAKFALLAAIEGPSKT